MIPWGARSKPKMIRTSITLSLLAALLLLGCKEDSTAPRPNVLLITLDTTRADYLSCYGYKRKTTPHMDSARSRGRSLQTCHELLCGNSGFTRNEF